MLQESKVLHSIKEGAREEMCTVAWKVLGTQEEYGDTHLWRGSWILKEKGNLESLEKVEGLRVIARTLAKEKKDINPSVSLGPLPTDQLTPVVELAW